MIYLSYDLLFILFYPFKDLLNLRFGWLIGNIYQFSLLRHYQIPSYLLPLFFSTILLGFMHLQKVPYQKLFRALFFSCITAFAACVLSEIISGRGNYLYWF